MKKAVGYALLAMLPWVLCGSLAIGQFPGGKPPRRPPVRPWDDDFDPLKNARPRPFDRPDPFDVPRPPVGVAPRTITVWRCEKCRCELSRGELEPVHIRNCPRCGVKFKDGPGAQGARIMGDIQAAANFYDRWSGPVAWTCLALGGLTVLIVLASGSWVVISRMQTSAKKSRRDRRDDDSILGRSSRL